jgi:hypothetical protein
MEAPAVPSIPKPKVERPAERVSVASGSAPAVPNDRASAAAAALAALLASGTDSDLRADFDALALRVDALANREPSEVRFVVNDRAGPAVEGARPELSAMVRRVAAGFNNLWMSGPAGSGKTTLAHDLAKALGRPFGFQSFSAASTEGSLIGSLDAQGNYRESAFVQAYENGGVYLLDEVDAAPAAADDEQEEPDHAPEPEREPSPNEGPRVKRGTGPRGDGIEISFPNKPAPDVLSRLKGLGFRWSPRSKVWYAKDSQAKYAAAVSMF